MEIGDQIVTVKLRLPDTGFRKAVAVGSSESRMGYWRAGREMSTLGLTDTGFEEVLGARKPAHAGGVCIPAIRSDGDHIGAPRNHPRRLWTVEAISCGKQIYIGDQI